MPESFGRIGQFQANGSFDQAGSPDRPAIPDQDGDQTLNHGRLAVHSCECLLSALVQPAPRMQICPPWSSTAWSLCGIASTRPGTGQNPSCAADSASTRTRSAVAFPNLPLARTDGPPSDRRALLAPTAAARPRLGTPRRPPRAPGTNAKRLGWIHSRCNVCRRVSVVATHSPT